jgi:hypothetical protein
LQAIRDYVQPKPGTRILIHGAAGGVGSFATQIGKLWGALVIGTASGEDIVYLRSLGHVQVVDYKHERFETVGQADGDAGPDRRRDGDALLRVSEEGRRDGFDGARGERGVGSPGGLGSSQTQTSRHESHEAALTWTATRSTQLNRCCTSWRRSIVYEWERT